jgi:hypothetical protein
MRMLLRARLDTEMANAALKSGALNTVMQGFLGQAKPEASFFTVSNGGRCCYFVFDMKDSSNMPPTLEDFYQVLGADIELAPAMNLEDLQKGLASLKH